MLRCDELVLSREGECNLLTHIEEKTYDQLLSTQEEADTKIIAHAVEILRHWKQSCYQVSFRWYRYSCFICSIAIQL